MEADWAKKSLLVSTWVFAGTDLCQKAPMAWKFLVIGNQQNSWESYGVPWRALISPRIRGGFRPRRTEATENLKPRCPRERGEVCPRPSHPCAKLATSTNMIDGGCKHGFFDGSRARQVGGRMGPGSGLYFSAGVERIRFYPSPTFSDKFLKGYEGVHQTMVARKCRLAECCSGAPSGKGREKTPTAPYR